VVFQCPYRGARYRGAIDLRYTLFHPEPVRSLTLRDTESSNSRPSHTRDQIIANEADLQMLASREQHGQRGTRQLRMSVRDKAIMGERFCRCY